MNIGQKILTCLGVLAILCIMAISLFGGEEGIGRILGLLLGCIVLFFIWLGNLVGLNFNESVILLWIISLVICGIFFYKVGFKEGKNEQNNP
jgi:uncharacterized membrane protein